MINETLKEKVIYFIKSYVSMAISILIAIAYIFIDLIAFNVESEPRLIITRTIIYVTISTSITILLRQQGIIFGTRDEIYLTTKKNYEKEVEDVDANDMDEWCDYKNNLKREIYIKRKLKRNRLNYNDYMAGIYDNPKVKKSLPKRAKKCLKWCDSLEVEIYSSDYLVSDSENIKTHSIRNKISSSQISIQKYLNKSAGKGLMSSLAVSIAFAYVTISFATDVSWANLFYSCIKVVTWLASGVVSMVGAMLFITITYKGIIEDKIIKIKEYKNWKSTSKQERRYELCTCTTTDTEH